MHILAPHPHQTLHLLHKLTPPLITIRGNSNQKHRHLRIHQTIRILSQRLTIFKTREIRHIKANKSNLRLFIIKFSIPSCSLLAPNVPVLHAVVFPYVVGVALQAEVDAGDGGVEGVVGDAGEEVVFLDDGVGEGDDFDGGGVCGFGCCLVVAHKLE